MEKTLAYWKANAEEDYINTPISVLKYISELEAHVNTWVPTSERLPEIDQKDNWNIEHKISKDVLTFSEWGMRWGRYYYMVGFWTITGVTSSNGIIVDFWMEIKPPQ